MSSDSNSQSFGEVTLLEDGEDSGGRRLSTVGDHRSLGVSRTWSSFDGRFEPANSPSALLDHTLLDRTLIDDASPGSSRTWAALGAPDGGGTGPDKRLNPYAKEFVPGVTVHEFAEQFKNWVFTSPWGIGEQNISCGQPIDSIWRESSIEQQLPHQDHVEIIPENLSFEGLREKEEQEQNKAMQTEAGREKEQEPAEPAKTKNKRFKILTGVKRRCSLM